MASSDYKHIPDSASYQNLHPGLFLERSARVYPDKVAVVYGDATYSYREFDERISRLSGALTAAGIQPGDRVAYLMPNIPAMLEGHYAPLRIGAVLVAINSRLSVREISYIIRHSGARALVFDSEFADVVASVLRSGIDMALLVEVAGAIPATGLQGAIEYEEFLKSGREVDPPDQNRSELDTIAINYTSGTTGEPKGVEYTGRGAYLNAIGQALDAGLSPASVYLWTLPMFHCNGWCHTWAVTAAGGTHVCLRHVRSEDVFQAVREHRVTHMAAAPSVLTILESSSMARANGLGGVRIFTGGSPPAPRTLRSVDAMGAELDHLYGLTETYGPSAIAAPQPGWQTLTIEEQAKEKSRQGVPTTTMHSGIRIVDDQMNDVPEDGETVGEVVARGNTVMKGYFLDPDATEGAFSGGWFHTGDIAVVHPDGYMEVKDRKKDVIISGGENISSVEVEKAIMEHPAVLETCVVGVPDELWGEAPKAFIALRAGSAATADEIVEFCRERIAGFKVPKQVQFGELPKTATGKIQKYVLREREWAGHERRIG